MLSVDSFLELSLADQMFFLRNIQKKLPNHIGIFTAQEGEDALIKRVLKDDFYKGGFYVDIGAHDPFRFSTTLNFYLNGWHGINIDPYPGSSIKFNQARPEDINIESGVNEVSETMPYYIFEEPAFNTFDKYQVDEALKKTELLEINELKVERLDCILDKYLPTGTSIDLLNIDVEGMELAVLNSNNWIKYHPTVIAVEALNNGAKTKIIDYLSIKGYRKIANTKNTLIFICNNYEC